MLRKILGVVVVAAAIFAGVVAMQPSDFNITRSTTIAAQPAAVFAHVNNFHNWGAWSPWAKLDLAAKNSFEGAEEGTGAIMRWAGNKKVGEGSQTIVESVPGELVRIKLDFVKPFAATHMADFTFKAEGEQTVVTWSMYGKKTFVAKAMSLVMNCKKMLGQKFEEGLAQLKTVSEASAPAAPTEAAEAMPAE